jgi:hypothetical protein
MATDDPISQRSFAAQTLMGGNETDGIELMKSYSNALAERFSTFLDPTDVFNADSSPTDAARFAYTKYNWSNYVDVKNLTFMRYRLKRLPSNGESEDFILTWLLSEASGGVRSQLRLSDLLLATIEIRNLDAKQRFRLGVGLAKLGLFDMSLKHVWLAATPWEAPLYQLRAKLVFSPVHGSLRALSLAVNNFGLQGESILLKKLPKSSLMVPICNSLNEAALALQALPLLHLAGVAAPLYSTVLGHSPEALPVLLGEVYTSMCATSGISISMQQALEKYHQST